MSQSRAERAIDNLINGNIEDAKRLAAGQSIQSLEQTARELGHPDRHARAISQYLKRRITWDEYLEETGE